MEEVLRSLVASQQALTDAVKTLPQTIASTLATCNHQDSAAKNDLIPNMRG